MALSANTVWEVRTAGNDTNGGGFVAGLGTDYSQQDSKNSGGTDSSTTDAVANGTTTITSASASFGLLSIVGNIIYLQGGSGGLAAGWYQVISRTNSTTIVVDRTVASGTGITMNIGGALANPGTASGLFVNGNILHIKAGTYSITTATPNVANGPISSTGSLIIVQGYQTTRGDLGTPPLLQAGNAISTFAIINLTGVDSSCINIDVDGATLTSSRGFTLRGVAYKLGALNCTNGGFLESTTAVFSRCYATGCSSVSAFAGGSYVDCIAYDNTITGFTFGTNGRYALRCIADSNTGASTDGFSVDLQNSCINCVAYGNGRDGFRAGDDNQLYENCIAEGNSGGGFNFNSNDSLYAFNCATYNNTSGAIINNSGKGNMTSNTALTGSPFTNAAGQDFSLNNTASAGASCRAAAFPGALFVGGTGYLDIGALQHQDPASGNSIGAQIFGG